MIWDKKSCMEWTNCDHHITMNIILRPQKISFPFDRIFINSSDYLVPWCGKRLYLRECTQVTASRSFLWIFDSQPGCSRRATYWFAQDRGTPGGPKIHFRVYLGCICILSILLAQYTHEFLFITINQMFGVKKKTIWCTIYGKRPKTLIKSLIKHSTN